MSVEFLVKIRDAATLLADAANEELEKHNPTTKTSQTNIQYEKILWVRVNNQKGEPYERYPTYKQQPNTTNKEYMTLIEKLKTSKFHQNNGLGYWLFDDKTTIGRKPLK